MEQHEIARAQDEVIRMYRDSLVSGSGMMGEGNAEDLISLAKAAMKKTKTQLETVMARHLAIADPRNGPGSRIHQRGMEFHDVGLFEC